MSRPSQRPTQGRALRIRLRACAVAGAGLLASGLSACSSAVETADLESEVGDTAAGQGFEVDAVDCPDELPAEVQASVVCTLTLQDGTELDVDVTATQVNEDTVSLIVRERQEPQPTRRT